MPINYGELKEDPKLPESELKEKIEETEIRQVENQAKELVKKLKQVRGPKDDIPNLGLEGWQLNLPLRSWPQAEPLLTDAAAEKRYLVVGENQKGKITLDYIETTPSETQRDHFEFLNGDITHKGTGELCQVSKNPHLFTHRPLPLLKLLLEEAEKALR